MCNLAHDRRHGALEVAVCSLASRSPSGCSTLPPEEYVGAMLDTMREFVIVVIECESYEVAMELTMADKKSVLVIGLDPALIDFSQPGYAPGMNATKVLVGLKASEDELIGLGCSVQTCLTDFGETAEAVVQSQLKQRRFDCILIGAGVRANPSNFMLFEKLINVVHEHAPQAKICFNTLPSDTAAAVKRWL